MPNRRVIYGIGFILSLLGLLMLTHLVAELSFDLPVPEAYLEHLKTAVYASAAVALVCVAGWYRETIRKPA